MLLKSTNTLFACLFGSVVFAGTMGESYQHQGFFIGAGVNYNSLHLQQNSWGLGISNVFINGTYNSTGIAQGNAAPFIANTQSLAPEVQAGYLRSFRDHFLYGIKFTYQYVGIVTTNRDLYLPQLGEQRAAGGSVTPLFGYAIADSIEATVNNNMNLLAVAGKQFGNKFFYIGAGPSVTSLKSQNYNSIGYAIIDTETVNVTGLVNYGSSTNWAWGGAAQIGMSYFVNPTWFIDASYTYSAVQSKLIRHEQHFNNTSFIGSNTFTTTGELATKDTFKPTLLQSINVSINKIFDL